ncbi:serine/threonine-protein phosphatase with EF-hands 1 [Aplochiton taeniatus]
MGCGTSITTETQTRRLETAMKAAILIQRWYRRYVARLEMRRRYTWNIFQSIEYAGEQDQLQLSGFFSFMLDNFTQLNGSGPDLISQLLDPVLEPWSERESSYDLIPVPESYSGPHLSFPLSMSHTHALLAAFKDQKLLHARYFVQLLQETRRLLRQIPNIRHLSIPYAKEITICGDLHGRLDDLLLIFYKNGLPSVDTPYLFNGDFVDRGKKSVEVLVLLFSFLLLYPDHMHLNRGNHEDHIMNLRYGFTKEVMQKYKSHGRQILRLLQDVFSLLPVATVIDSRVLIVHGGISDQTDLDFLSTIDRHKVKSALRLPRQMGRQTGSPRPSSRYTKNTRTPTQRRKRLLSGQSSGSSSSSSSSSSLCSPRTPSRLSPRPSPCTPSMPCSREIPPLSFLDCLSALAPPPSPPQQELEWKQVVDILWSDPKPQAGCSPNTFRGGGCYFGPDVTRTLLLHHGLLLLVRSHECKQEGYEVCHNGQVITIFSASNYYEEGSNRGAYIKLGQELVPRFYQYQVSQTTRRLTLTQRVSVAESSAVRALKEKLFAHRSELMTAFQQYDYNNTGCISVSDWAVAIESVLKLDLPWRTLRPRLARLTLGGAVEYSSCFEDMGPGQPLPQVTPNLAETLYRYRTDLEIIFNIIDKDHSGQISIEEFRQTWRLFSAHLGVAVDDQAIDDLARSIDFNKDGSIDFNEFLEAFRVVHKLDYKDQQQG